MRTIQDDTTECAIGYVENMFNRVPTLATVRSIPTKLLAKALYIIKVFNDDGSTRNKLEFQDKSDRDMFAAGLSDQVAYQCIDKTGLVRKRQQREHKRDKSHIFLSSVKALATKLDDNIPIPI